jgi:7,8-dihydro-6-hydroxymethylpterin-pyrophosphokinase
LCVHTELSAEELLTQLLEIEISMGRVRSSELKYTSRSIDLDVLFYADQIISTEFLTVPHPRLALRNFILFPMAEIAPNWVDPKLEKSILELLAASPDKSIPKRLGEELSVK